ncbi:substrate-binding domain-containing protein [Granulosicoccus antarcticus]|uniref:HTH-type transcriptional regulator RafR n=1 Tax=Granulosicoccus antarcticus IMCC3135 TaxID=1192854 RepID=A0A2Z2NRZ2_9GAMM|nr:substrate-binding domain-containing protein [Granulosicoccus antarcticus]ASJ74143.1 HTH-type transcriptional regulator RafR [Granulosicoccus antarcticus IMCC3135]
MAAVQDSKGTLKGIATELNLSVTTVSRALGGFSDVAPATRQRVLDAAARAGYSPNSAARSLVTGRTNFVCLIFPLRDRARIDPFLGEYITGLSEGLVECGRDLFLSTVASNQTDLGVLRHVVESGRADGIVLNRIAEHDERVDYLIKRGFPFVTHGRTLENSAEHSWIDTDGKKAFSDMFKWLYSLGHRRFGLLSITEAMSFRSHREEGLQEAIAEQNDPDVSVVIQRVPQFDIDAREFSVNQLLNDRHRPTVILALTDEMGLCVLERAAQMGISVPDELSVIGYDNIPESAYAKPGLTTFDQSTQDTARQMAALLANILDGQTGITQTMIEPILIKRGSHGPAPAPAPVVSSITNH